MAESVEFPAVREFFELFKTPWEPYDSSRQYDVIICTTKDVPAVKAKLIIAFASACEKLSLACEFRINGQVNQAVLQYGAHRLPIYRGCLLFTQTGEELLRLVSDQRTAALRFQTDRGAVVAVGYNLFAEVDYLLREGQPIENAQGATLEKHIDFVRRLIVGSGARMIEIPPVPAGYRFAVCLTHDVDHAKIQLHKFSAGMLGFLYRSTVGAVIAWFKGIRPFRHVARSLLALAKLPLVYVGLAQDYWHQFERYDQIEAGLGSTFFVVPIGKKAGLKDDGSAPSKRAVHYKVEDITDDLHALADKGREIAVHGINSWCDEASGPMERQRLADFSRSSEIGIRMHWLYFDSNSPRLLDRAGYTYDSTVGYNQTIGFKAGTCQVYRPLGTETLLELPLHVMDTALFLQGHMNLSFEHAMRLTEQVIDNAVEYGGALTINWHDRSLGPERFWDSFYEDLISSLKQKRAWFPTAAECVAWFRQRRNATFQKSEDGLDTFHIAQTTADRLPGLTVRVYNDATDSLSPNIQTNDRQMSSSGCVTAKS